MTAKAPASDDLTTGASMRHRSRPRRHRRLIVATPPLGAIRGAVADHRRGPDRIDRTEQEPSITRINDGLWRYSFCLVGPRSSARRSRARCRAQSRRHCPWIAAFGGFCHAGGDLCRGELGRRPRIGGLGHPAATDIAFRWVFCAMLGTQGPASLKIFLMALAIIDD